MMRASHVILLMALAGCRPNADSAPSPSSESLQFTTLARGAHSGVVEARALVLRDAASFAALWAEHSAIVEPAPELPTVDLEKEMVIAVFSGMRRSSGYELEIEKVVATTNEILVLYRERGPDPSGGTLTVLTHPHHLISTTRGDQEVRFERLE